MVAISGCHGKDTAKLVVREEPTSNGVIAWVDKPAPEVTPAPVPTPTAEFAECRADQITATAEQGGAAGGTYYEAVRFTNVSSDPCTLSGPSDVIAIGSDGTRRSIKPEGEDLRGPGPVNLQPAGHGWLTLSAADACDDAFAGKNNDVVSIDVVIGTGDVPADLPAPVNAICGLSASRFGAPFTFPEDLSPLDVLQAHAQLPATLPAGQTLDYTVTLTNASEHDLTLSPCPSYQEGVFAGQFTPQRYYLNCDDLPSIAAGQTVTLAMRVDVPAVSPGTWAKFVWRIQGSAVGFGDGVELR